MPMTSITKLRAQIDRDLVRCEKEQAALRQLKAALDAATENPAPESAASEAGEVVKLTQRKAVESVIKAAKGKVVTAPEVLIRTRRLGIEIKGKQPVGIVDLLARDMAKRPGSHIERVSPHQYRWADVTVQ